MFDKKETNNLIKGIELLAEDMHDKNSKELLFCLHAEEGDETGMNIKVSYYGNPRILAAVMCASKDKIMQEITEDIFGMMLYKQLANNSIFAYDTVNKQFLNLTQEDKWNENNTLQAQENESLKPKKRGWITRLLYSLRILKS
jgi:hypothetical protein